MKYLESQIGYVITGLADGTDELKFYAIDRDSGGYPYWSDYFSSAEIFKDLEKAKAVLNSSDFTRISKMSGGTLYPPPMVQSGAEICSAKPKGSLIVEIREIQLHYSTINKKFEGEIKEPKGYVY